MTLRPPSSPPVSPHLQIGKLGILALSSSLGLNASLLHLDLSSNLIFQEDVAPLAAVLSWNERLFLLVDSEQVRQAMVGWCAMEERGRVEDWGGGREPRNREKGRAGWGEGGGESKTTGRALRGGRGGRVGVRGTGGSDWSV
eukprot:539296-Hanusia_phi.AAC.1